MSPVESGAQDEGGHHGERWSGSLCVVARMCRRVASRKWRSRIRRSVHGCRRCTGAAGVGSACGAHVRVRGACACAGSRCGCGRGRGARAEGVGPQTGGAAVTAAPALPARRCAARSWRGPSARISRALAARRSPARPPPGAASQGVARARAGVAAVPASGSRSRRRRAKQSARRPGPSPPWPPR